MAVGSSDEAGSRHTQQSTVSAIPRANPDGSSWSWQIGDGSHRHRDKAGEGRENACIPQLQPDEISESQRPKPPPGTLWLPGPASQGQVSQPRPAAPPGLDPVALLRVPSPRVRCGRQWRPTSCLPTTSLWKQASGPVDTTIFLPTPACRAYACWLATVPPATVATPHRDPQPAPYRIFLLKT